MFNGHSDSEIKNAVDTTAQETDEFEKDILEKECSGGIDCNNNQNDKEDKEVEMEVKVETQLEAKTKTELVLKFDKEEEDVEDNFKDEGISIEKSVVAINKSDESTNKLLQGLFNSHSDSESNSDKYDVNSDGEDDRCDDFEASRDSNLKVWKKYMSLMSKSKMLLIFVKKDELEKERMRNK